MKKIIKTIQSLYEYYCKDCGEGFASETEQSNCAECISLNIESI